MDKKKLHTRLDTISSKNKAEKIKAIKEKVSLDLSLLEQNKVPVKSALR